LPFDDNLLVRYGPRILDGLEELARIFHPEIFK
jgi:ABC-type Fe3+-hydroxamate transport system substrate-binding protein